MKENKDKNETQTDTEQTHTHTHVCECVDASLQPTMSESPDGTRDRVLDY